MSQASTSRRFGSDRWTRLTFEMKGAPIRFRSGPDAFSNETGQGFDAYSIFAAGSVSGARSWKYLIAAA